MKHIYNQFIVIVYYIIIGIMEHVKYRKCKMIPYYYYWYYRTYKILP